ncbi:MAG: hypothetical protein ABW221_20245 [Vicinamibacteria bacterium]
MTVIATALLGLALTGPQAQGQAAENSWHSKQQAIDCPAAPYDEAALAAVKRTVKGARDLRTRPNPKGEGVVVTSWNDANRPNSPDYSRRRLVWLVLGKTTYPLNEDAANAQGRLLRALPAAVRTKAGLVAPGKGDTDTYADQLGIDDFEVIRSVSGKNPFPTCE